MSNFFTEKDRYNGVLLEKQSDKAVAVAMSGAKLCVLKLDIDPDTPDFQVFIPDSNLQSFGALSKIPEYCELSFNDERFTFDLGNEQRSFVLGDLSNIPNWRRVLPNDGYELEPANYSTHQLNDIQKFGNVLQGKNGVLDFSLAPNGKNAALITFDNSKDCFAILMPVKKEMFTSKPFEV